MPYPITYGPRPACLSRFCEHCHTVYQCSRQDARYCSATCRQAARRLRVAAAMADAASAGYVPRKKPRAPARGSKRKI